MRDLDRKYLDKIPSLAPLVRVLRKVSQKAGMYGIAIGIERDYSLNLAFAQRVYFYRRDIRTRKMVTLTLQEAMDFVRAANLSDFIVRIKAEIDRALCSKEIEKLDNVFRQIRDHSLTMGGLRVAVAQVELGQ